MAADNELSFLHVIKPEIDLPEDTDQYSDIVYTKGAENLKKLTDHEALIRDIEPCFYVYQQRMGDHVQAGIVAAASVVEYEQDLIKKHEHTRKDKEDDRTRHIDVSNANAGPVFLTYRAQKEIDEIVAEIRARQPHYDFVSADGIGHTLWVAGDKMTVEHLQKAFQAVGCLYVADGHHRSASAARVAKMRRERNPNHTGEESYNYFLTVIFPDDQLQILPYNRVVTDLSTYDKAAFLEKLSEKFDITPTDKPSPAQPHHFGLYLDEQWRRLVAKPGSYPEGDPVKSLDAQILAENILAPILDIHDLRTDKRINFVGGIRGAQELEKLVDGGRYAAAFALYPTTVDQLMAIADAGLVMPPKSTWFEPKLRSGMVVRVLDE